MKIEPIIVAFGGIYLFGERIVAGTSFELEALEGFRPRPGMDTLRNARGLSFLNPHIGASLATNPDAYKNFKISAPVQYSTIVLPYESYICTEAAAQYLKNLPSGPKL